MSFSKIAALLVVLSAVASAQYTVPPTTTDPLDAASGVTVTAFTSGIFPHPNAAIGVNAGAPEPGHCFCPNVGLGNSSFIEVTTGPVPVVLTGGRLYGANDGAANGFKRAMGGFKLRADTDGDGSFETLAADVTIDPNYANQPGNAATLSNFLELTLSFPAIVSRRWRMEFVQGTGFSGIFEGVRIVEFDGIGNPACAASTYCTAGTSTHGCVASISATGIPSASASSGFTISVSSLEGEKSGLIYYGIDNTGFTPHPFGSGTSFWCVKAPVQRTILRFSGGTSNTCNGSFSLDWNAFVASTPGCLGSPFSIGDDVFAQAWYRDPTSPDTVNFSNALEFSVCP